MQRRILVLATVAAVLSGSAFAQTQPQGTPAPLRGTVERLDGRVLQLTTREGQSVSVTLADPVGVSAVARKSLADIKTNDYVGVAAVKGTDGKLHAQEVLIFPKALRGAGEGQHPWNLTSGSTMTNASVAQVASAPSGRTLRLVYKTGEAEIEVPPDAPIVTLVPGDKSLLKPGAAVFMIALRHADGSFSASRVTAEKDGVKPPM
jgi:hypothetical protein